MNYVVFDIETTAAFPRMAERSAVDLDVAVVGVYEKDTDVYTSYAVEELGDLWPIMERADALVGFNSDSFDIPILNKYYPGDLATIKSIDILTDVYKSLGRRLRLGALAEATLGEGKSADGLKAIEWWQAGEYQKVRDYCLQDVKVTKNLFEYALTRGYVKYKDLKEVKRIKIDTSNWLTPPENAITHTLGL